MFATQSSDARRIKTAVMLMLVDIAQHGNPSNCSDLRKYGNLRDIVISIT
jgi:hypothetical protein